jgi:adenosylhomocysteine nucleosidase
VSNETHHEAARARLPLAPPPVPADIGLVAALPIEVSPLIDQFRRVRRYAGPRHTIIEGEYGGKLVALIVTGPGRVAARRGAELVLAGHRPRWIVSAGFAGALDPDLARNDIFFANEVLDEVGSRLAIDVRVPNDAQAGRVAAGRLLTVDRIIRTQAEKAALRGRHQADAVDMETISVASLCGERGTRFLSVRVISDEAGTDLPPEILSILGRSGGYRLGATLGAVWKRPSSLKDLLRLREHALTAADHLARVLAAAIGRLP